MQGRPHLRGISAVAILEFFSVVPVYEMARSVRLATFLYTFGTMSHTTDLRFGKPRRTNRLHARSTHGWHASRSMN